MMMSHMIVYISHGHSHADISDFSEETLAVSTGGPSTEVEKVAHPVILDDRKYF